MGEGREAPEGDLEVVSGGRGRSKSVEEPRDFPGGPAVKTPSVLPMQGA